MAGNYSRGTISPQEDFVYVKRGAIQRLEEKIIELTYLSEVTPIVIRGALVEMGFSPMDAENILLKISSNMQKHLEGKTKS